MAIHEILKMGDPRLLRVAPPVLQFGTPALHTLIADMFDTMEAAQGAGLAAPQIGVDLGGSARQLATLGLAGATGGLSLLATRMLSSPQSSGTAACQTALAVAGPVATAPAARPAPGTRLGLPWSTTR